MKIRVKRKYVALHFFILLLFICVLNYLVVEYLNVSSFVVVSVIVISIVYSAIYTVALYTMYFEVNDTTFIFKSSIFRSSNYEIHISDLKTIRKTKILKIYQIDFNQKKVRINSRLFNDIEDFISLLKHKCDIE